MIALNCSLVKEVMAEKERRRAFPKSGTQFASRLQRYGILPTQADANERLRDVNEIMIDTTKATPAILKNKQRVTLGITESDM